MPRTADGRAAEELYRTQLAESIAWTTKVTTTPRLSTAELVKRAEKRWGPKHRWTCVYCGRSTGMLVDHFVPLRAGGTNHPENLVPACDRCNLHKNDRDPIDWMDAVGVPQTRIDILSAVTLNRDWTAPRNLTITRADLDYPAGRAAPRAISLEAMTEW